MQEQPKSIAELAYCIYNTFSDHTGVEHGSDYMNLKKEI